MVCDRTVRQVSPCAQTAPDHRLQAGDEELRLARSPIAREVAQRGLREIERLPVSPHRLEVVRATKGVGCWEGTPLADERHVTSEDPLFRLDRRPSACPEGAGDQ